MSDSNHHSRESYEQIRAELKNAQIAMENYDEVSYDTDRSHHRLNADGLAPDGLDDDDTNEFRNGMQDIAYRSFQLLYVTSLFLAKILYRIYLYFRERPLLFCEILVWLLYCIVGVVYYTNVEGWNFIQSFYFITVTFSTIGYGQYVPTTAHSKVFTSFYCVVGVLCVLTAINRAVTNTLITVQKPVMDFFLGNHLHLPSTKIGFSIIVIFILIVLGLLVFAALEDWSYADSFYWTITTMTTIGYGGQEIKNEFTLYWGVLFIYSTVFVYSLALQNIQNSLSDMQSHTKRSMQLKEIQRAGVFHSSMIRQDMKIYLEDDECSKFVLLCLMKLKRIDLQQDCEPIIKFWLNGKDDMLYKREDLIYEYLNKGSSNGTTNTTNGHQKSTVSGHYDDLTMTHSDSESSIQLPSSNAIAIGDEPFAYHSDKSHSSSPARSPRSAATGSGNSSPTNRLNTAVMHQKINEYVSMNEQQRLVQAARMGRIESPLHGADKDKNSGDNGFNSDHDDDHDKDESKDHTSSFEEISLHSGKYTNRADHSSSSRDNGEANMDDV